MSRGDLHRAVLPKEYGKPRPALIIQADVFDATPTVAVLPLTTHLSNVPAFRIRVEPTQANGLHATSDIQIEKPMTVHRAKLRERIGSLDARLLTVVDEALGRFLGLR